MLVRCRSSLTAHVWLLSPQNGNVSGDTAAKQTPAAALFAGVHGKNRWVHGSDVVGGTVVVVVVGAPVVVVVEVVVGATVVVVESGRRANARAIDASRTIEADRPIVDHAVAVVVDPVADLLLWTDAALADDDAADAGIATLRARADAELPQRLADIRRILDVLVGLTVAIVVDPVADFGRRTDRAAACRRAIDQHAANSAFTLAIPTVDQIRAEVPSGSHVCPTDPCPLHVALTLHCWLKSAAESERISGESAARHTLLQHCSFAAQGCESWNTRPKGRGGGRGRRDSRGRRRVVVADSSRRCLSSRRGCRCGRRRGRGCRGRGGRRRDCRSRGRWGSGGRCRRASRCNRGLSLVRPSWWSESLSLSVGADVVEVGGTGNDKSGSSAFARRAAAGVAVGIAAADTAGFAYAGIARADHVAAEWAWVTWAAAAPTPPTPSGRRYCLSIPGG